MKRFQNILFFAEGESEPSPALRRAFRLAETNHARLTLVDVVEPIDTPSELRSQLGVDLNEVLRERRLAELDALTTPHKSDETLIYTEVLSGTPFIQIIRAVKRRGYDLVIKAARGPQDVSEQLFGSTDLHLLRKCPCPVWIDQPTAEPYYANVLAAVDPMAPPGEGCDRLVMDLASSIAEREGAVLTVVHAWQLDGESMLRHGRLRLPAKDLDNLLDGTKSRHRDKLAALLAPYGMHAEEERVHLVKGNPSPVIRGVATRLPADLIVMGTVGRVGLPGFFIGNTVEEVIQTTSASVLAVKPLGFVSPVE